MPIENILLSLAIMLIVAKITGMIAERLGVASLVGQLIGGIVIGPLLGITVAGAFINDFLTLAIIFLLFMAGLEVKYEDIKKHIYSAAILAFLGGFFSFILGFIVAFAFFHDTIIAFAIGTVLISTSDVALFMFLTKSGEFDSKIGKLIIATTIADDVASILFLSFFSAYIKFHTLALNNVFFIFLVSMGFYFIMFTAGSKMVNGMLNVAGKFLDSTVLLAVPVAFAFLLAYITENIGLSLATGSFLAGMAIANSQYSEKVISPKVSILGDGFLVPVFFVAIGTQLVFGGLNWLLIAALTAAAAIGKFVGVGVMSRFFDVKGRSAKLLGIMMIPRGNENVALVQIILLMGVISYTVYTSIVFVTVATILITPVILKLFYSD